MNARPDSDLLRDYAEKGDESAFSDLVTRHIALVYSVALRVVVDPHLAEDVTQTTFVILAREANHLAGRTLLSSWLHRTASNQAAKMVRGEMRRRSREQESYAMQTAQIESEPNWKQLAPMLDAALNQLTEEDRVALLLRFFEKKTAFEIGGIMRLGEEAAQKKVHRALVRLRGILSAKGTSLTTATLATLVAAQAVVAAPAGLPTSVSAAALAGSNATGGITLITLKLILMSKLKIGAVSALVVASITAPLVVQRQSLSRLRSENKSLQLQARQAEELRVENVQLLKQLSEAKQTQRLSKAEFSELLRLRGEVGPLRGESQELARLRDRQRAGPAGQVDPPRDYLSANAWANVGTGKPEEAIQTFFWASKHGETNLVGNLLRWRRDPEIPASDELDENFSRGMISGATKFAGDLQGFRVTSREEEPGGEVRLGIELTSKDGKPETHILRLIQEDGQWFPVMHVWLQEKGSIRAALEVPDKFRTK